MDVSKPLVRSVAIAIYQIGELFDTLVSSSSILLLFQF